MPANKHHPSLDATPELGVHGLKKILTTRKYLREHCEFLTPVLNETILETSEAVLPILRSKRNLRYLGLSRKPKAEQAHLEAQLERAMFQRWSKHDANSECVWHRIIDYQVPVKDRQRSTLGLKAIDLLGIDKAGMPVIIELKIIREQKGRKGADTPLLALLEAVSYASIIRADWPHFKIELEAQCKKIGIEETLPDALTRFPLVVAGPPEYWEFWNKDARSSTVEAKPAFRELVEAFSKVGYPVHFMSIQGSSKTPERLVATKAQFLED